MLLAFATPAAAEVYSGTTSGFSDLSISIPKGPGKYQLTFRFDTPPPFDITILTQSHYDQYMLGSNAYVGGNDVQNYDTYGYYADPARAGVVRWEVGSAYSTRDTRYRTDYRFNGVRAYFSFLGDRDTTVRYTVNVAAVPEPQQWALLIGGFGLAGAALRRRRRTPVTMIPAA
ncbi:PEPxxWA-CTERM sorting domain-containing protein [Sphingomonas sp.]|uniref:PEPxxWA-CTERM sorting domain-containing protein n=1 Tax=Sphingomonas sp. TaxID=28214 RepID=UPI0028B0CCDC|nr:PEPxxWA-CTERM sorting domain-containing protein [Sphingomonas sp.]